MKWLLTDLKTISWSKFKNNLSNKFIIVSLIFIYVSMIYTFSYNYNWNDSEASNGAINQMVGVSVSLTIFLFIFRERTMQSYLIFLIIFHFLLLLLTFVARDVQALSKNYGGHPMGYAIHDFIQILQLIILSSFAYANMSLFIIMIIGYLFSYFDSLITHKIGKKPKKKIIYFTISHIVLMFIITILLFFIYEAEKEKIFEIFKRDLLKISTQEFVDHYADLLFLFLSQIFFLLWLPLFLRINLWRNTNMLGNTSGIVGIASLIILLYRLTDVSGNFPIVLYTIVFFDVIGALFLTYYSCLFLYVIKMNWKEAIAERDTGQTYIPYVFTNKLKKNKWIIRLYEKKDKRLEQIEN